MSNFKPWLPSKAIDFFESIINEDSLVLEHGAGSSTVWLGHRADYTLSFETDPKWYNKVGNWLERERVLDRVSLIFASDIDTASFRLPSRAPREYDIVFVDGRGRIKFWERARKYLKPGGWLVWDDAERQKYWSKDGIGKLKIKDWVKNPEGDDEIESVVDLNINGFWPVISFTKPEKPTAYTLFARKPYG